MSTTAQPAVDRLPRGPHRLSRAEVESHQRERMLAAMIAVAGKKGYGSTTIGDITRGARVSRDTFYEQFANKEACLLAAYDATVQSLLGEIVSVGRSQPSYLGGVRAGVRAYLKFLSQQPDAARMCTLEIMAAGRDALDHRERTIRRSARLFGSISERARSEQPDLPTVPDVVSRAIVVAALELTTRYVRENRTSSLGELENDLLYLWLMGLAGHEVAAAALAG